MWQMKRWITAAEIIQLLSKLQWKMWTHGHEKWESLKSSASCRPFVKDQTLLWRSPGYCPVKMRPVESYASMLLLGLPINPSYLPLARKSPLLAPSTEGQAPGMLHPQLTTILSTNTLERLSSPLLIVLSLTSSVFSPALSSRSCQATCVTRGSGKKGFKTHWHASPKSIFGECSFFLWKQKSHREK